MPARTARRRRPPGGVDLNLRIFAPLGRYVRKHHGLSALEDVTSAAGLNEDSLDGASRWASVEQVEVLLADVRALVGNDQTFEAACSYELAHALGPLRFALWATTPIGVQLWAVKQMRLVSRVSRFEVVSHTATSLELRYTSSKPESRLLCLARRAQGAALPTLWGLPRGTLRKGKCIANGDDSCEYSWRFHRPRTIWPAMTGAGAGLAIALGLRALGVDLFEGHVLLPALGLAAGVVAESVRRQRANTRVDEEIVDGLRDIIGKSAEAQLELHAIQERERVWGRLVEEQLAEKTGLVERIAAVAAKAQESEHKVAALRGVSHDMGTSIGVLKTTSDLLRMAEASLGEEARALASEQARAIEQLEQMLASVIEASAPDGRVLTLSTSTVDVPPLVETIAKRLRALAYGRELHTAVTMEREAPERVETDLVVLDRILDNLLSNAVKYTDVGSVEVTITGTPGFLTIKVADTGRGFDTRDATAILSGEAFRRIDTPAEGFGIGLSVVVQLLGAIGGRLELSSKAAEGSTFWAHIPETVRPETDSDDPGKPLGGRKLVSRVVTVRRAFMLD